MKDICNSLVNLAFSLGGFTDELLGILAIKPMKVYEGFMLFNILEQRK